jgi:hypothetical protein
VAVSVPDSVMDLYGCFIVSLTVIFTRKGILERTVLYTEMYYCASLYVWMKVLVFLLVEFYVYMNTLISPATQNTSSNPTARNEIPLN